MQCSTTKLNRLPEESKTQYIITQGFPNGELFLFCTDHWQNLSDDVMNIRHGTLNADQRAFYLTKGEEIVSLPMHVTCTYARMQYPNCWTVVNEQVDGWSFAL